MSHTQANKIDHQHTMLQRDQGEVDRLHPRPDHQVGFVTGPVAVSQLLQRIVAFHDGHGREEEKHVCWSEEELIATDAGCEGKLGTAQDNVPLHEFVPGCGAGAEDRCN